MDIVSIHKSNIPIIIIRSRIGRTGRAGNLGTALTFCSQEERKLVNDIQKLTGKKLSKVEFAI